MHESTCGYCGRPTCSWQCLQEHELTCEWPPRHPDSSDEEDGGETDMVRREEIVRLPVRYGSPHGLWVERIERLRGEEREQCEHREPLRHRRPLHQALLLVPPTFVEDGYVDYLRAFGKATGAEIIGASFQGRSDKHINKDGITIIPGSCAKQLPENAEPGDLLKVELLDLGPLEEWGFTGTFHRDNGGGFLTDHYPQATKACWDFEGVYCKSRHIPGVKFAGLIHPGLIGTAPSAELLEIWNTREAALEALLLSDLSNFSIHKAVFESRSAFCIPGRHCISC